MDQEDRAVTNGSFQVRHASSIMEQEIRNTERARRDVIISFALGFAIALVLAALGY